MTKPSASGPHATPFDRSFCILGVVLIVLGLALTFRWVISDPNTPKFLGAGDCWSYYGPALHYMDNRIHHGEFPLWNPLYFCGQPHAANPQSWVFYPPNLLRSLLTLHPTPFRTHGGIAIMIGMHLLLGGMTTLLLARSHGLSLGAALTAAFVFTFSAAMVTRAVGHWIFLNCVCWLPLLLLLIKLTLQQADWLRKARTSLLAGLVLGLSILGDIHLVAYVGLSAGIYALLLRALYPRMGQPGLSEKDLLAPSRKGSKKWKKAGAAQAGAGKESKVRLLFRVLEGDATVGVLILLTGALVASALLFPGWGFSRLTDRADVGAAINEHLAPLDGVWGLMRAIIIYQGHGQYEGVRAAGGGAFFLALVALTWRPRKDVVLFACLFLALLDCSVANSVLFGQLIDYVTPFKNTSPGRTMIVACLPLGLLAGMGVDAVLAPICSVRQRIFRSAWIALLGLGVVWVLILAQRPEPLLPVGKMVVVIPGALCLVAVVAGWITEPLLWGMVLAMLILGETLAWNKYLIPTILSGGSLYKESMENLKKTPEFWGDNRRGTVVTPNVPMYQLRPAINGYDPLELVDVQKVLTSRQLQKVYRRVIAPIEVSGLNVRDNSFLKRSFWLGRQYVQGPLPKGSALSAPATTVFLDTDGTPLPVPEAERAVLPDSGVSEETQRITLKPSTTPPLVVQSEEMKKGFVVHVKPARIPRLHSSLYVAIAASTDVNFQPFFKASGMDRIEPGREFIVKAGDDGSRPHSVPMPDLDSVEILLQPDFKGRQGQFSVLELFVLSDLKDEDGLISVRSRSANRVDVDIAALPDYRILQFVDAYYPGWTAEVDGKPAHIYRANDAFKAVVLPPGPHQVHFVFRSWRVEVGATISLTTLLAILIVLVRTHIRLKRLAPDAQARPEKDAVECFQISGNVY